MEADARDIEAELIAYYDQEAEDRVRRPLSPQRAEARRKFIDGINPLGPPLLEVGTGPGRDVRAFAASGFRVVGVDLSLEQSRYAQAAGAHQVVASVRRLPFRDNTFGSIWTMSTLMHVPNSAINGALDEIRRVLAPGGQAGIGVWGGPDLEEYFDNGELTPRLFSRRSDAVWQRLLMRVGVIEEYQSWRWDEEANDLGYQWARIRGK